MARTKTHGRTKEWKPRKIGKQCFYMPFVIPKVSWSVPDTLTRKSNKHQTKTGAKQGTMPLGQFIMYVHQRRLRHRINIKMTEEPIKKQKAEL